jgi:hypothetical protein
VLVVQVRLHTHNTETDTHTDTHTHTHIDPCIHRYTTQMHRYIEECNGDTGQLTCECRDGRREERGLHGRNRHTREAGLGRGGGVGRGQGGKTGVGGVTLTYLNSIPELYPKPYQQHYKGPRFCIPRRFRPDKYDYYRRIPMVDISENEVGVCVLQDFFFLR